MSPFRFSLAVVVLGAALASPALAAECPAVLAEASRLALVNVPDMTTTRATLRTYERADTGSTWTESGAPRSVVIGRSGLAWGHPFVSYAKPGEPVKREGDKRTPAGIYRFGAPFGFAADARDGYMQLTPGAQYCVDDTRSPYYGRIVDRSVAGKDTSGENMGEEQLYERGIVIDYPPNASDKAGSCIFLHIWAGEGSGTAGCVAMPEADVEQMQDWAQDKGAVIAILSEDAAPRFAGCLP
jgi:L,D-peptidoglycan transpeptidase YkuD (ErfK/YbiS/YcfS/YnhG family)